MSISMYRVAVPPLLQILKGLSIVLDKAAAHCEQRKIDPAVLLTMRLYPDMFTTTRQVQIATDQAKGCVARLAGVEVPVYADDETSFAELKARVAKTTDFVKSFPPERIDGSETKEITLTIGGRTLNFDGQTYLVNFVLPNFYFHAATTYGILRHCGVEIGKRDYLAAPEEAR